MKLVRWLLRGIAPNGRVMEPGEEMLLEDHILLSDHQVDLTAIAAGNDAATRDQVETPLVAEHLVAATPPVGAPVVESVPEPVFEPAPAPEPPPEG